MMCCWARAETTRFPVATTTTTSPAALGDDSVSGDLGNDTLVWNPGDGNDINEGGDGTDTSQVNGGNGAETFTLVANGTRVRFDRTTPAPFFLDIGTVENFVLNMNGGDDIFTGGNGLATLIALTVDGGTGNDQITGTDGNDVLIGGDNNDTIAAGRGNDVVFGGNGDDTFIWNPGDGSDTDEGQADNDTLQFNGANVNEKIDVSANGSRVRFTRDVASIVMDLNGIETVNFKALGGADTITVNDLTGTNTSQISLDLGASGGRQRRRGRQRDRQRHRGRGRGLGRRRRIVAHRRRTRRAGRRDQRRACE